MASRPYNPKPAQDERWLSALGLDWEIGADGTLTCSTTVHGADARLLLDPSDPDAPTLSLIGPSGTLWSCPLDPTALLPS